MCSILFSSESLLRDHRKFHEPVIRLRGAKFCRALIVQEIQHLLFSGNFKAVGIGLFSFFTRLKSAAECDVRCNFTLFGLEANVMQLEIAQRFINSHIAASFIGCASVRAARGFIKSHRRLTMATVPLLLSARNMNITDQQNGFVKPGKFLIGELCFLCS